MPSRPTSWLIAACAALGLLSIAVVILHEVATTRWPASVVRWSPSFDHRMRAALAISERSGQEVARSADALRAAAGGVALERLLERARVADARGHRAAIALVLRASERAGASPARSAVRALLRDGDPRLRLTLIEILARHDPGAIGIVVPALADPHPAVAAAAAAVLARDGLCARLRCQDAVPVLGPRLLRAVRYASAPGPHEIPEDLLASDRSGLVLWTARLHQPMRVGPWRPAWPAEIDALARMARTTALDALLCLDAEVGIDAAAALVRDDDVHAAAAAIELLRRAGGRAYGTGARARAVLADLSRQDLAGWDGALRALLAAEMESGSADSLPTWSAVGDIARMDRRRGRVVEIVAAVLAGVPDDTAMVALEGLRVAERTPGILAALACLPARWRAHAEDPDAIPRYGSIIGRGGPRTRRTLADYCLEDLPER